MQVTRQVRLEDRRANPTRVYEMALVKVGEEQYLVNFSFGRDGHVLSEGSKTVRPFTLERATAIFDHEVESKLRLGYELISDEMGVTVPSTDAAHQAHSHTSQPSPPAKEPSETSVKSQDIMVEHDPAHIAQLVKQLRGSKAGRAQWRLGLMRATKTVPQMEQALAAASKDIDKYSGIWALGRCGESSSVAVLRQQDESPMRSAALIACGDTQERDEIGSALNDYQGLLAETNAEVLEKQLKAMTKRKKNGDSEVDPELFVLMYVHGSQNKMFVGALAGAVGDFVIGPATQGWFRAMRQTAKLAEFYDDPVMYTAVLRWFDKTRHMFDNSEYAYVHVQGAGWLWGEQVAEELRKPDSRIAYSSKTRDYFKRRFWRHLRHLGELKSPRYVEMATELLLSYRDEDAGWARTTRTYSWVHEDGRWQNSIRENNYGAWASFITLNQLLYRNSSRYKLSQSRRAFVKVGEEGQGREEAFSELWDQRPDLIMQLLLNAEALPVTEFAAVAIRSHMDYLRDVPMEVVIDLLQSESAKVAELGFALAQERYDADNPNADLVDALLDSESEPARRFGMECVQRGLNHFSADVDFVVSSLTSRYADVRMGLKLVYGAANWSADQQEILVGKIIGVIHSYKDAEEKAVANGVIADLGFAMQSLFPELIKTVSLDVIDDLLKHPLNEAQALGARLLLNHQTPPEKLPAGVVAGLIKAENPEVRGIGVRLFGQMPDEVLLEQDQVFVAFFASEHKELRENARTPVGRLARKDEAFASRVVNGLLLVLLESEKGEGHHDLILDTLRNELSSGLSGVSDTALWTLLRAQSKTAQQMGAQVLARQTDIRKFPVRQLASLGNHRLLDVRAWVQNAFAADKDYICTDLENGIRIMDSDWDDTQTFAGQYFEHEIAAEHWTPDILVAVCDSTRPQVQAVGRRILQKFFETEHGEEYLLKLSQHPSTDMQLFASALLHEYAADKPATVLSLKFYFRVVLGQVYKGRVAKARALDFLLAEARKSPDVAEMVAEMVADHSLTIAVMDKAKCIALLTQLRTEHPAIPSSVTVVAAENRG